MSLPKMCQNPTLRRVGPATVEAVGKHDYKVWKEGELLGRVKKQGRLTWTIADPDNVPTDCSASTLKSAVNHLLESA